MKKFGAYVRADLKRLLCSGKLLLSAALTVGVLLIGAGEGISLEAGVLYVFSLVMYGMPAMVILVCASLAFADSFCEDMEHRYVTQQLLRGNAGAYISARILTIFLSAMAASALGIFLFANILHLHLAWVEEPGLQNYDALARGGGLRSFLRNGRFELYFLCYGMQYGMLSGLLSLWASCLSLYISNRMLVFAAPMILYYFADYLLAWMFPGRINLGLIFSASYNLFYNDLLPVLFAAAVAMVNMMLAGFLMIGKIRRMVYE